MSEFWTNRRAAVAREEEAERVKLETLRREEADAKVAEKSDEELLDELGLPDPDQMDEGSDFKVFLQDAVPARLRSRALRRLWRVNPVLANLDGLLEYGEDYTDAATVIENLQSTYQVGKGMLAHIEEMARQEEAKAQAEQSDDANEDKDDESSPSDEEVAFEDTSDNADHPELEGMSDVVVEPMSARVEETDQQDPEVLHIPRHRRMTFSFEDQKSG